MGAYFAYEQHVMGARKSFSLFALSMALLLIEVFMLTKLDVSHGSPMYFFLPPATFFLFSTVVRMKIGGSKKSYKIMRSLSTFIYVVHMLVNRVIGIAFDKIGFWAGKVPLLMYSLTIIASVGIGLLVIELSKRKTFKCLKYLY